MDKVKNIIICLLFLIIILLRTCDSLNPKCKDNFIHDTIKVEKWDTIRPSPKIIYLKPKNLTPVASYTLNGTKASFDSICSLKQVYSDSLVDSNLVFYYKDTIQGRLLSKEMSYKLKIPLIITHTIENTITLQPKSRVGIYGGLQLGGNSKQFNLAPFIVLVDKKDNLYSLNYNLTDKTVNVGFGIKINKKVK